VTSVGDFSLRQGSWKLEGEFLTLELRGLNISDYWFWWKIKYRVLALGTDCMQLQVEEILKQKELEPDAKWEELIQE
jgi:hypothetical protein